MPMYAPVRIAAFSSLLALAACSAQGESGQPSSQDASSSQTRADDAGADSLGGDGMAARPDNCLLLVWQDQDERDERFDLAHDSADGGAISCATGTSASQFDRALAAIRLAAQSRDKTAILDQIGLPLLYIDANGNRRELSQTDEVDATFADVFDDDVLTLLGEVDLDALTVVPDQGAFVQLGSVWLVVDRNGGQPRIVTVNKQALDEAAVAVRKKAQSGQGAEAPARTSE